MCGICGFTGNGDQSILETMMEAMAYRGPDAAGSWNDEEGVYLGHRRLSIVDIADGHQPMLTEDASLVLVLNTSAQWIGILIASPRSGVPRLCFSN